MRFKSLDKWLGWQESLNPKEIDLGLERVSRVLHQAGLNNQFDCPLITVAGTNGKGSVVAYLEAIALAAGVATCSYTSPHILRYNERIRINGREIDDDSLCMAFDRIDRARGGVPLTYFEFGTLAAIDLFMAARPDLVIMEVGLGGRLDAVNVMQPSTAVITTIAIDHTDWLGTDREAIGFEKAGILRAGRAAVCADENPPQSLLEHAAQLGVDLKLIGEDFRVERCAQGWRLMTADSVLDALPMPALAGEFQLSNAASSIIALGSLHGFNADVDAIQQGLLHAVLPGRYQLIHHQPAVIVDVAHNPQAAESLLSQLKSEPCSGKTHAVVAMLADKPVTDIVERLSSEIDCWYTAGLEAVPRGLSARQMAYTVERLTSDVKLCAAATVAGACDLALAAAARDDRIIIFGSFYTVAEATQFFTHHS